MNNEKEIDKLTEHFFELESKSKIKTRKLESDKNGNLLLDRDRPEDVEWYQDDDVWS